jgi:hypothetical protein
MVDSRHHKAVWAVVLVGGAIIGAHLLAKWLKI